MKSIISIILFFIIVYSCGTNSGIENENTTTKTVKIVSVDKEETEDVSTPYLGIKNPNQGGPDDDEIQRIGFYNVENLFDTEDDPKKKDEEFLPEGKKTWTTERYQEKLDHLSKVIDHMGQPGIMGLCEVENEAVLKALVKQKSIKDAKYNCVHQESPDFRGIDVALLYSKDEYQLVSKDFIRIDFPASVVKDYTTRDMLHATLKNKDKEYIHVFVCHWPSRRGGLKASEPKRVYVAEQVRKEIDNIFDKYDDNHVIVMGDLNDEPSNKSVRQILQATAEVPTPEKEKLYNLMDKWDKKGHGTYVYKDNWNMLDHIIVSGSLLDGEKTDVKNAQIFNRKFMLYYSKDNKEYRPSRTFSGSKYYGGYSDHLPVCAEIGN